MYCPACGTEVGNADAFCKSCGRTLKAVAAAMAASATGETPAPPATGMTDRPGPIPATPAAPPLAQGKAIDSAPQAAHADSETPPPAEPSRHSAKRIDDLRADATGIRNALAATIVMAAVALVIGVWLGSLDRGAGHGQSDIALFVIAILDLGSLVGAVTTALRTGIWIYWATANCGRLGAKLPINPSTAVALCLLPVVNLISLPAVVAILMKGSAGTASLRGTPLPALLWVLTATSVLGLGLGLRVALIAAGAPSSGPADALGPIVRAMLVPTPISWLLFVSIARVISETQVATAASMGLLFPAGRQPRQATK